MVLYDTRAYSPRRLAVLSSAQMYELVAYWLNGLCPVCFTEIPKGDTICDDCLKKAVSARL
jgi:predicted amidophosphoribosyltransferase